MPSATLIRLTADERRVLKTQARSPGGRADAARRARITLLLADGASYTEIGCLVGCTAMTIAKWKTRSRAARLGGLRSHHRGSKPRVLKPQLETRILNWTRRTPPHGATHWSTRTLGRKLSVQHAVVALAWQRAGLQPHGLVR